MNRTGVVTSISDDTSPTSSQGLASVLTRVIEYVNDKTAEFSRALSSRVLDSTRGIASKIDEVAETVGGQCSNSVSKDDVEVLTLPKKHVRAFDNLRRKYPARYAELALYAHQYTTVSKKRRPRDANAARFIEQWLQSL